MADADLTRSLRSHSFLSPVSGSPVRVREVEDGHCFLETISSGFTEHARITGPEILKLAEQGRALWIALDSAIDSWGDTRDGSGSLVYQACVNVLHQTAATFDQDEPERQPATVKGVAADSCEWVEDKRTGAWDTACGTFSLEVGSPSDNDMRFCCFCGKPLAEKRFQPEEDEEACGETFDTREVPRGEA